MYLHHNIIVIVPTMYDIQVLYSIENGGFRFASFNLPRNQRLHYDLISYRLTSHVVLIFMVMMVENRWVRCWYSFAYI